MEIRAAEVDIANPVQQEEKPVDSADADGMEFHAAEVDTWSSRRKDLQTPSIFAPNA